MHTDSNHAPVRSFIGKPVEKQVTEVCIISCCCCWHLKQDLSTVIIHYNVIRKTAQGDDASEAPSDTTRSCIELKRGMCWRKCSAVDNRVRDISSCVIIAAIVCCGEAIADFFAAAHTAAAVLLLLQHHDYLGSPVLHRASQ